MALDPLKLTLVAGLSSIRGKLSLCALFLVGVIVALIYGNTLTTEQSKLFTAYTDHLSRAKENLLHLSILTQRLQARSTLKKTTTSKEPLAKQDLNQLIKQTDRFFGRWVTRSFPKIHAKYQSPWLIDVLQTAKRDWDTRVKPYIRTLAASGYGSRSLASDDAIFAQKYFDTLSLQLGEQINQSRYGLQQIHNDLENYQLLLICFGLIVLIVLLVLGHSIGSRLLSLSSTAGSIAEGDTFVRAQDNQRDEIGNVAQAFNTMTNQLVQSREYLNNIIDNMADMMFVVSPKGLILKVNAAVIHSLGFPREDLVGRKFNVILAEHETISPVAKFEMSDKDTEMNTTLRTDHGLPVPTTFTGAYLDLGDEGEPAVLFVMKDLRIYTDLARESKLRADAEAEITEVRRRSEELSTLNEELVEAQHRLVENTRLTALGEMATGIGYEINAPLNTIVSTAQWLDGQLDSAQISPEKCHERIRVIHQMSKRISQVIHGLQVYARDGREDPFQPKKLKPILEETLALCRSHTPSKTIVVKEEPIPENLMLECRETQISQLLFGLIKNAHEAAETMDDKWVHVGFREEGDHIEISITDSGTGIPESEHLRIFQPFYTTKALGKSTGLGLSTCYSIAKAHQGTIIIDTECEHTRFVVRLPKKRENQTS